MKIVVLDTETSGFTPPDNGSGVCDFAYTHIGLDTGVLKSGSSLLHPGCEIGASAMGVHHITNEMVQDAATLDEFMEAEGFPLADADVIVGHNVSFDYRFVKDHCPPNVKQLCTLKLSRRIFTTDLFPSLQDHKLQTLRYFFKLDAGDAHRAMGDVLATVNLLRQLAYTAQTDLEGLIQLQDAPLPPTYRLTFGKHRGVMLKDLPQDYINWFLTKAKDPDPELVRAMKSL